MGDKGLSKVVKAIKVVMLLLTMLMTCGMDMSDDNQKIGSLMESIVNNWKGELNKRIEANLSVVDRLESAGLLSKERSDNLKAAINSQEKRINDLRFRDAREFVVWTNGIARGYTNGRGPDITSGFEIISMDRDGAIKELSETLDFEIYVLKRDPSDLGTGENALVTLDVVADEVNKAKNNQPNKLDHYFVNTGKKVLDLTKPENQLIKVTEPLLQEFTRCEGYPTSHTNVLGKDFIGVSTSYHEINEFEGHTDCDSVIHIRFFEFNPVAIEKLIGASGVNKDKYVIIGNRCYLMEYPVYYVEGFTNNTEDEENASSSEDSGFTTVYKESDIKVNILTNTIMYKDGSVTIGKEDILKVFGEGEYSELGKASFVVDGIKGKEPKEGYLRESTVLGIKVKDELKNEENYGRIVLRDYLELSYIPGVVSNEHLVALGRRVRITKFKGSEDNQEIGLFIDTKGNEVQNSIRIKVSDVMDIKSGKDGDRTKYKLQISKEDGETGVQIDDNTSYTDVMSNGHNRILDTEYIDKINTSVIFPGDVIATYDKLIEINEENLGDGEGQEDRIGKYVKHFFYGMAIDIDPFRSNLFSGWINISGDDAGTGSMDWWNYWLRETGYRYTLDRTKVIDFFSGNYVFEMRDTGYIILDIPTIINIQREYEEKDIEKSATNIRTMLAIIGALMIAYAFLVIIMWAYDTNIIMGPRLLTLVTFGKWVAVSYDDELPDINTQGKVYMNFTKVAQASILMIAAGILITTTDMLAVIDKIIVVIGALAQIFSNIIRGI